MEHHRNVRKAWDYLGGSLFISINYVADRDNRHAPLLL